ncbi:DnaJ -like protein subfamily C member 17 [Trichinella pseudospiralis]|uniref:DnaJ-like protein subfamily C member 17 n=1 Tax=Trichinella pseudospiralis TaxID=6337 RepID=A0A0V0Y9T8_TRIPS|nr:DnaJ -like protein subfamily C member 17 [Trichinella pseudospiralis]
MSKSEKLDFDPYDLLEVDEDATENDVIKAYRKQALKWHPDKNPDCKEQASAMFLKISRSLEILTDASARAALNHLRKAKREAKKRFEHLDSKRRKLREELEVRENTVNLKKNEEQQAYKDLASEVFVIFALNGFSFFLNIILFYIERLRKAGSKILQQEREKVEKKIREERMPASSSHLDFVLKIKWDESMTNVSEELIREQFEKVRNEKMFHSMNFGQVEDVIVNRGLKKFAILSFASEEGMSKAKAACDDSAVPFRYASDKSKERDQTTETTAKSDSTNEYLDRTTLKGHLRFESDILSRMREAALKQNATKQ